MKILQQLRLEDVPFWRERTNWFCLICDPIRKRAIFEVRCPICKRPWRNRSDSHSILLKPAVETLYKFPLHASNEVLSQYYERQLQMVWQNVPLEISRLVLEFCLSTIKVGDFVDIRDENGVWIPAFIESIRKKTQSNNSSVKQFELLVRSVGMENTLEWVTITNCKESKWKIAPLNYKSKTSLMRLTSLWSDPIRRRETHALLVSKGYDSRKAQTALECLGDKADVDILKIYIDSHL